MAEKEKPVIITLPPFEERHAENEPDFLFAKHTRRIFQANAENFEMLYDLETNRRHGYTVMVGDSNRWFPLAIVRGAHPGPKAVITAGIDANEATAIKAALELTYELDFTKMHGTVCIVPVADTAAFERRGTSGNPSEGRALGTLFPGNAEGTLDEQVASGLWQLVETADLYLDLRSGNAHEATAPHTRFFTPLLGEDPHGQDRSLELAHATSAALLVPAQGKSNGSVAGCAAAEGIPTLQPLRGGLGVLDREGVDALKADVLGVLRSQGVLEGTFDDHQASQTVLSDTTEARSLYTGAWQPRVHAGDAIGAGQLLGTVTDPFGNTMATLTARHDGVVLSVVESLNLIKGETAVLYAGK